MTALKAVLEQKVKAVAAAVVSGVLAYVIGALQADTALTGRGLVLAAVVAVGTALGVHQAPRNKEPHTGKQ